MRIFFLMVVFFTHCELNAQWVKIFCPVAPDLLRTHGGYIYVGSEGGLFRTSDYGQTWLGVNNGLITSTSDPEIAMIYSFNKNYLFVFSRYGGLFRSTDNGASWENTGNGFMAITADHNGYLFARPVLGSHIMRSSDTGMTWKHIMDGLFFGLPSYKNDYTNPALMNGIVYTCNGGGEVYHTTNDGEIWEKIYTHSAQKWFYIYTVNDTTLIAFTPDTLFRSTSGGYSWEPIRVGLGNAHNIAVKDSLIVIHHGRSLALSLDNGTTWRAINDNLPDYDHIDVTDLLIAGDYLYLGTYSYGLFLRRLSTLSADESPTINEKIIVSPNPSDGKGNISFEVEKYSYIRAEIYNTLGQKLQVLLDDYYSEGSHQIQYDLSSLPIGVYHLRFYSNGRDEIRLINIIR